MAVMRERVEAMKAIWTSDEASYEGEYVSFDRIWSWPKPAQRPHPPVLVGGDGPGVLDRVLSFGDAWFPNHAPEGILERARELRARAARPIALMVMGVPADARVLEAYAAAGFQRAVHELPSAPRGPVERALDRYEAAIAELNGESRPLGPQEPGNAAAPSVRLRGVDDRVAEVRAAHRGCPRVGSLHSDPSIAIKES
jgi:alkanesulfonate monooxygenase SsuD/methylene tetrahydromethanopterin reductase-like flavin-dependent oxidoreductase (luciferase family)